MLGFTFYMLFNRPYFPSCFSVHVDANDRLARLKQILHEIPPHNLAVIKRIMFHLNRYVTSPSVHPLCFCFVFLLPPLPFRKKERKKELLACVMCKLAPLERCDPVKFTIDFDDYK